MSGKTRAARKKLALIADGPPPKEEPEECPIEANTAAMKRISAFAKNAAAKTETKNKEMLAEHNTQIEEMKGRLTAVEKTQRWVEEMAAELGVPMETVAAAIDGDGSAKKQFLMAMAAAAYQMEPSRPRALGAEGADDGVEKKADDLNDEEGPKLRPIEDLLADVPAISEFGAAAKERADALSAQNKKELERLQMDIDTMEENMSAHAELRREVRRLKVMVCILICAVVVMAVAYYRK